MAVFSGTGISSYPAHTSKQGLCDQSCCVCVCVWCVCGVCVCSVCVVCVWCVLCVLCVVCVTISLLLPARASEQGNVIGSVRVYICHQKKNCN